MEVYSAGGATAVVSVNPLRATIKPQSNGPLYSNKIVSTLAVDGRAVTFWYSDGPGQAAASPRHSSLYQM